jgi:hypothetical protein
MQHNRKVITTPMTTITRSKANTTAVWLLFKIREQVNMTWLVYYFSQYHGGSYWTTRENNLELI